MALIARLRKLERGRARPGEPCPSPFCTHVIDAGDPLPEGEGGCPLCGQPHVLELTEEIVSADGGGPG